MVGGRLMGRCPLHADHQPSFLLDPNKNLFYCYGCGHGGDVVGFAELYHGVRFTEAMALLLTSCSQQPRMTHTRLGTWLAGTWSP